jgi:hypothetical protein
MPTFSLDQPIELFCVTAASFPKEVQKAFRKLHDLIPADKPRDSFGLSWLGEDGQILYKAAIQEADPGELAAHDLETYVIRSGTYLYHDIPDFMNHISEIGSVFQELTRHPEIDPQGAAIEWYMRDVCRCMVALRE